MLGSRGGYRSGVVEDALDQELLFGSMRGVCQSDLRRQRRTRLVGAQDVCQGHGMCRGSHALHVKLLQPGHVVQDLRQLPPIEIDFRFTQLEPGQMGHFLDFLTCQQQPTPFQVTASSTSSSEAPNCAMYSSSVQKFSGAVNRSM